MARLSGWQRRWRQGCCLSILCAWLVGCTTQAPYMKGWTGVENVSNRWTGGTFREQKLSEAEATAYAELGTPDAVRFFRALDTRQKVYEWIYLGRDQIVWFVDRDRVDYVAVDTSSSALRKETRETLSDKVIKGSVLGALIGGAATGVLLLGEDLGIK